MGIEEQIKRNAEKVLMDLKDTLLKTGNALLFNVSGIDVDRDEMVVHTSTLVKREKRLVETVVKMVEALVRFLKEPYESGVFQQPDIIPTHLSSLGTHWEYFSIGAPRYTATADRFAALSGYNPSVSVPMIRNCCDLVKSVCELVTVLITKDKWKLKDESRHPDGIIGHVYDVLLYYDKKVMQENRGQSGEQSKIAREFKKQFQKGANNLRARASDLWARAEELWKNPKHDGEFQTKLALKYLERALVLIGENNKEDSAFQLVKDVTAFLKDLQELSK